LGSLISYIPSFLVTGRPPTYSSTDQFVDTFILLQQNRNVNTDVGVRLMG